MVLLMEDLKVAGARGKNFSGVEAVWLQAVFVTVALPG